MGRVHQTENMLGLCMSQVWWYTVCGKHRSAVLMSLDTFGSYLVSASYVKSKIKNTSRRVFARLLIVAEKRAHRGPQKACVSPEEVWIRGSVALWELKTIKRASCVFSYFLSLSFSFSSCLFWSPMFHFSANLVHSESERWEGGGRKTKERKAQVMTQQRESPSLRSTRRSTCTQGSPRLPSLCPALHSSVAAFPCLLFFLFLAHRKDGVFLEARWSFLIPVCRFPHGAPYTSSSDKTQTARPTDPCRCL